MRLLHVVPSYVPAWRYGGPIRSVHGLCKALHRAGHDVRVFTTNADGSGELDVPVGRPVDVEGVQVTYFPDRFRRLYWSPAMVAALRRSVADFDIVHLHSIYLWPTTAGARWAKRSRVPYVLSPRGMLIPQLIRGRNRWIKRAWISVFEKANIRDAAAIHFTSEREARDAARLGLSFPRVLVIPNGADGMDATPGPRPVGDVPYVAFLGRISWEKGLDRLVAALAFASGVRLVVAGEGDPALARRLVEIARESGVVDRVRFAGAVDGPAKWSLLREAIALVLPSPSESFGNVVIEAMAAGTPAIVTPGVGAAEVVREHGCGIVADGDPRSLGEAIAALADDSTVRDAMGRRGEEAFRAEFTWDVVARRMAEAYSRIVAERQA